MNEENKNINNTENTSEENISPEGKNLSEEINTEGVQQEPPKNENEYIVSTPTYAPISGEGEYARWSYKQQAVRDRKAIRKSGIKSALVFTAVMSAAFSAAIVALVLSLIFGSALYKTEKVVYRDKVIYVREDGKTSGSLSIPEITDKLDPSIVFIDVKTEKGGGTATGIVMSADGYVLTNAHVVEDATNIKIILNDKTEYEATLCGADYVADLAVIKATPSTPLTPAQFGSSEDLLVGESVVAIGCPAGYTATTTEGIISAVNREIEMFDDDGRLEKTMTLLQTNANINPGNSGGALIDMDGKVIGVTTLKLVKSEAGINYDGLGFAIPITPALEIAEVLKAGGESYGGNVASKVPTLGVTGTIVTKGELNSATNEKSPESGFYVTEIVEKSSADGVISVGDIIISVEDKAVNDVTVIKNILKEKKAGDVISAKVYRNGKTETVSITLK